VADHVSLHGNLLKLLISAYSLGPCVQVHTELLSGPVSAHKRISSELPALQNDACLVNNEYLYINRFISIVNNTHTDTQQTKNTALKFSIEFLNHIITSKAFNA
jgi:hypothetical protein